MENTIAIRIYDFLKQFPPFNFMAKEDLISICNEAQVLYLDKDQVVFKRDTSYNDHFYIVQQGAIKLTRPSKETEKVVDICDEGDIFGLKVTHENTYRTTATANEETILYSLPSAAFNTFATVNKAISNYLIASFASNIKDPYSLQASGQLTNTYDREINRDIYGIEPARYSEKVIRCSVRKTVQKAAQRMQENQIGCLVVTTDKIPQGVVTNRELRNAIAKGNLTSETLVTAVMTTPVVCAKPGITVGQAQLILMKNGISHIVITQDGTQKSEVVGILSKHDIVVAFANSPAGLIKEIKRAPRTKDLRHAWQKSTLLLERYLSQNLPLSHILNIFRELKEALMQRALALSLRKMSTPPPVAYAWLALGSQGRNEQLLYTDQDNALIYENVPLEKVEETKAYFLRLATRMNKRLHKIGYDYCPADMMASNPLYCLSQQEWESQFNHWITTPTAESMLLSSIFFDFHYVAGEIRLSTDLTHFINNKLENAQQFFRFMAKDALKNPPPVSFFRQFLVESNGEHKDEFDIKNRAMAPLIAAARILTLYHRKTDLTNTAARFEQLATLEPENRELYENCAYAFKALLKFRTRQGLAQGNTGRFIDLTQLSKPEKLKLKRCFKPLRDVQEVLRVRFQTQHVNA